MPAAPQPSRAQLGWQSTAVGGREESRSPDSAPSPATTGMDAGDSLCLPRLSGGGGEGSAQCPQGWEEQVPVHRELPRAEKEPQDPSGKFCCTGFHGPPGSNIWPAVCDCSKGTGNPLPSPQLEATDPSQEGQSPHKHPQDASAHLGGGSLTCALRGIGFQTSSLACA